ncbi:MAG TPA: translocation/assembly module TamB domain-containing protein, partial [Bacteroidales bacterium]|nr:translocation/assembly module TamB domain-containing protein [Bacteroidales bacterium]
SPVHSEAAEANANVPAQKDTESWRIKVDDAKLQFERITLRNLVAGGSLDYLSSIMLANVRMDFSALMNNVHSWNFNLKLLRLEDLRTSRLMTLVANANAEGERMNLSPFTFRVGNSHVTGNAQVARMGEKGAMPDFNASVTSSNFVVSDLEPYLPKSLYSSLSRIPRQVMLTANVTARNQLLRGDGQVRSEQGDVDFTAQMDQSSSYDINVLLKDIDAGFFAQNQQLGRVSADIKANGSGFTPDSMLTDFSLEIPTLDYNGNTYNRIRVKGNITKGKLVANLVTSDPIANVVMNVKGDLSSEPDFNVNAHIQNLDLHAMKLITDTIAISGVIDASYSAKDSVNFEASTDTFLVDIKLPKRKIHTNTALRYAVAGDSVDAVVKSNFGDVRYAGNVALQDIGSLMKGYFARHFNQTADTLTTAGKYFRLDIKIDNLNVLSELINQWIEIPEEAHISAELKNNRFSSNADIEKLVYNDLEIDGLKLDASGRDSSFQIDFKTAAFHNSVYPVKDISLQSNLQRGDLVTRLQVSDADSKKWFDIGFAMQSQNPALNVVIREPLLLDHQTWKVAENNRTSVQNKNVVFENVKLTSGDKSISLLSDARQPEKLAVSFKNLTMALISEIVNGDTTFLSGKINGDLMATSLFAKTVPVFDAKLDMSEIVLDRRNLGNLNIAANNAQNNDIAQLNVDFGLEKMKLNLNGSYGLQKNEPMNISLTTKNLDLAAIQPLLKELISDASGAINASLNVKGLVSNPSIDGQIDFDKVAAFIEPIQSKFSIDRQRIMFRNQQVDFNRFTIKDADGSSMVLNGRVALENLKNLQYNLDINSKEFLAYQGPPNSIPGQDNKVIITSGIKVTGQNNIPQVNATIKIDEGSKFFYKITKQASNLTEEGVIEFEGTQGQDETERAEPQPSAIENLSMTANITVAENTAVTIITDPLRNLGLKMTASGIFTMDQQPFQSPRLTGRLDISGGDYTMSLSGLRRRFQIADSSYIVWYGNISEPELNLRAYYEVRTSPAELLGEQSAEASSTLPFMVNMIISGSLSDPKFNFRLSLPREYEGVDNGVVAAKLQEINSNESDLNQKAMALLLFGSFGFDNFSNVLTSNGGGYNVIISNA